MLDDKIIDRARRLIESRFAERRNALSEKVERIMCKLGFEGCARSSGAFKLVRDACDSEIDIKANIVSGSIQDVLNAVGSPVTNTLAKALKQEVGYHYIDSTVEEISKYMIQRLSMLKSKSDARYFDFENIKRDVKEKFDVEVDLYVDSLLCKLTETEHKGGKPKPKKRGRKKDPKVRTRNKKIAEYRALNFKLTWKEIGSEFGVSADIARKACNNPAN